MKITEYFESGIEVQYRVGRYDPSMVTPRWGPIHKAEIFIDKELVALPELEFRASEAEDKGDYYDVNVEDWYLEILK